VRVLGFEQIDERLQTPKGVNKELFNVDEPAKNGIILPAKELPIVC
jgi:hypothetical protein